MIAQMIKTDWLIEHDALSRMYCLADRDIKSIEHMVEGRNGEPMAYSYKVEIRDSVAVIPVRGPIFRHANIMTEVCGATSIEILARDFQAALDNKQIKSILLNIDSPGGQVTGINEFSEMVYEARSKKPIKAYVDGMAASAAYFIASACDEIILDEMGMVGSIGVVTSIMKKADGAIEFVSSQSPNKRLNAETEEGRRKLQARIDDLASVFIGKVARNRGRSAVEVIEAGDMGGLIVGINSVAAGLADRLGNFETLVSEMNGMKEKENIEQEEKIMEQNDIDRIKAEGLAIGQQEERERVAAILNMNIDGAEKIIAEAITSGASVQDTSTKVFALVKEKSKLKVDEKSALYVAPIAESGLEGQEEKEINMLLKHMNAQVK